MKLERRYEIANRRSDIGSVESKRDIRLDIPCLVTAIEAAAAEFIGVEWLAADHPRHCIGQLDLTPGALFLRLEYAHHFGLEDVTAGNHQVRRRGA